MPQKGFVVGRFAVALSNTPTDGGEPRLYPLAGQLEFQPIDVGPLYDGDVATTVSQEPVFVDLDSSGYILNSAEGLPSGSRGHWLPEGDYWVYLHTQYRNAVQPMYAEVKASHTEIAPLDLTLAQPYRPRIGNALIEDRMRAEQAAADSLAERQSVRDMFMGGTTAINDAAIETYIRNGGSLTNAALDEMYASLENGMVQRAQLPEATVTNRGVMSPADKARLNQAILASDLSEGIKSAALAGHGEFTGEDGATYNMIGGVIRPPTEGGDWILHTNSAHPTVGVTDITTTDEQIILHYPGHGHTGVVSFLAVTDETLASHGVTAGCSVTTTEARLRLGGRVGYAGQIRWESGIGLVVVNNSSFVHPDRVTVAWDGVNTAVVSHPRLPVENKDVAPQFTGRTPHVHMISNTTPFGAEGFGIMRRDISDGSINTSQADYFCSFQNYAHGRLNPRLFIGNHWTWANIWYFGVFQTSPYTGP